MKLGQKLWEVYGWFLFVFWLGEWNWIEMKDILFENFIIAFSAKWNIYLTNVNLNLF